MNNSLTTNIHEKSGSGLEDTCVGLLGRTIVLRAEIRTLQNDQRRLLTALGLDPERDGINTAVEAAEALVAMLLDAK